MNLVNWSFITSDQLGIDHPPCTAVLIPSDYTPFRNLSKDIISTRKGATYLKCPAHTDFLKNTFVFCAPFDLTIDIGVDKLTNNARVYCENISQETFDSIIDTRFISNKSKKSSMFSLIGVDWLTVFTSSASTMIQVMPAFMHRNDFTEKTTIIPGEYDIGKWTRAIQTVFEIRSNQERIVIKQGDAICYMKFLSNNPVQLVKLATPWNEMIDCIEITKADRFRPLQERYKSLSTTKADTCPYNHNQ
jgi:hypothetical protein